MSFRSITAWFAVLTLCLGFLCSCETGGNYRHANYRFGGGVSYGGFYGRPGWGYYPGYPVHPERLPEYDGPVALPLPEMGMPDLGGPYLGGFD